MSAIEHDAMPEHRLSLAKIADAARVIDPVFLGSPQFVSEGLSARLGCAMTLKVETANPIGSFKGRGASYFVACLAAAGEVPPLVCASAGNFGQAMAYVCRSRGLGLTVFASVNASPLKIAKMRAFGAEVRLEGEDFDAAKFAAKKWAAQTGALMVEDGLQVEISEGAGTIGLELLARGDVFDAVLLPPGNGALLNGAARWLKAHAPATRVVGVSSVHAPAMRNSWLAGRVIEHAEARTIADGIAVRVPIAEAVEDMRGIVDEVVLVEEASVVEAMWEVFEAERMVVEPAGAAGVAALLEHEALRRYRRVATVLCGNNATREGNAEWMAG